MAWKVLRMTADEEYRRLGGKLEEAFAAAYMAAHGPQGAGLFFWSAPNGNGGEYFASPAAVRLLSIPPLSAFRWTDADGLKLGSSFLVGSAEMADLVKK